MNGHLQSTLPPGSPAERGQVHNVNPHSNPAHILAPPRHWLDSLSQGAWGWAFFRLRYKNLLRQRVQADPGRFRDLLDSADKQGGMQLECACGSAQCHAPLADEFLQGLREKGTLTLRKQVRRDAGSQWREGLKTRMVLATLTEPSPVMKSA